LGTNPSINAYDLANFLKIFDNSSSHTLTNDGPTSNSGHGIEVSNKHQRCDIGCGPTSHAKRFRDAAAEKQRSIDKIVEQNVVLIEQNHTFLQQQ
jgi:hypothetical protein